MIVFIETCFALFGRISGLEMIVPFCSKDVALELHRRSMRVKDVMRHMRALEAFPGMPSMAIVRAARLVEREGAP
jgi:hypothetical protein